MIPRTKILSILLLLALSGGCAAMIGGDRPAGASFAAVPLDSGRPGAGTVGALNFRGALDLAGTGGIGGLSGLWVADDGGRFVGIGDTGRVATGRLEYDAAGWLIGVEEMRARPLAVEEGLNAKKRRTDAEDLTRLPDGGWLVAFERDHRILRYPTGDDGPDGAPVPIPLPPTVAATVPGNGGLESLARLSDGRLLTIEEGEDGADQERRAWLTRGPALPRQPADWLPLTYRTAPRYRATGAASLPDGGALVLERRVSLIGGWSARIVRVRADSLRPGAVVDGEELARLESPLLNDNFEGIATRRGPAGETLVYLIADDNFSPLQRTYLVMFSLPPA